MSRPLVEYGQWRWEWGAPGLVTGGGPERVTTEAPPDDWTPPPPVGFRPPPREVEPMLWEGDDA